MAEGCPRHRRVVIAHPFGGQAQGYHGTLDLIAFHFHGAAVQFHKLFRERQTKASALVTSRITPFRLGEGLQDIVKPFRRDAGLQTLPGPVWRD